MGELILCKNRIAAEPYFLEAAELHLYSIEEVCWFILHNLYTADRELMSYDFIDWMGRSLQEPDLSDRLVRCMKGKGNPYQFLMTILMAVPGYCTREELRAADKTLKELLNQSPVERMKTMTDVDLKEGRYSRAINAYRRLLKDEDLKNESQELVGNVHHNLGIAYCGMFLFQEAAQEFTLACELNHSKASEEALSYARELADGKDPFGTPADGSASYALAKAAEAKRMQDTEGFYEKLHAYAIGLKEEYRASCLT